jgi:hypothetical protein
MGPVTTAKLLARKRPRLIPVYDSVVQCAFGGPEGPWKWMNRLFSEAGGELNTQLPAARGAAAVPEAVTPLRILDVITWMRHRSEHRRRDCRGLEPITV